METRKKQQLFIFVPTTTSNLLEHFQKHATATKKFVVPSVDTYLKIHFNSILCAPSWSLSVTVNGYSSCFAFMKFCILLSDSRLAMGGVHGFPQSLQARARIVS
jgi:hypothetical protein